MKKHSKNEEMQEWITEICPQAINSMRDLLADPNTPVASKVQLISMILDRTLGKPATPLKVMTEAESVTEAEAKLMALVEEMQGERGKP